MKKKPIGKSIILGILAVIGIAVLALVMVIIVLSVTEHKPEE